jgi:hypothetical protein
MEAGYQRTRDADADRICACVNAGAGMEDPAAELAALRTERDNLHEQLDRKTTAALFFQRKAAEGEADREELLAARAFIPKLDTMLSDAKAERDRLREALKLARLAMTNNRYNKPRIDMEGACAASDAALEGGGK